MNKLRLHEEELHSLYMPKCNADAANLQDAILYCRYFLCGWIGEKNEDYNIDSCIYTDVHFYKQDLQDLLWLDP